MSIKTIQNMVDWVEDNLENAPTLSQMAAYVGYSQYYCSAKFHEYTGISFKEYVISRKLSLAADALIKSDTKIIEIAIQCGFSSHEAFTRAFGKKYQCTPYEYRKNNRAEKT